MKVKLEDICITITDGKHGDCNNLIDSGFYFISSKDIREGKINYENTRQITESDFNETNKRTRFDINDILITNSGTIGRMAIGKDSPLTKVTTFQKSVAILKPNIQKVVPLWLYYNINANIEELADKANGAAQKNLLLKDLRKFEIILAPILQQKKIAFILSAYDDLIENNLKRIKLLEESAQMIYKEWFVNFRFPGYESATFVDGLPEGWSQKSIQEIFGKLQSGTRPKGGIDKNISKGVPSIGAENVIGLGKYNYNSEKFITNDFYEKMNHGKIEDRDILIYKDGAYIGKTTLFQDNFPYKKCCINEHVFLLRAFDIVYQYFLFFTLNQPLYYKKMQNLNANAAQPGINQGAIKSLIILWPSKKIVLQFNYKITATIKQIFILAKQNQLLIQARDILLPKLMSGEIEV